MFPPVGRNRRAEGVDDGPFSLLVVVF
jgi:hypothetical protein